MIDPAQLWRKAGESGERLLAVQSGLIALIFALVFLGRSITDLPLAVMALASVTVAATFGYILWRPLAMRPDGVNLRGALDRRRGLAAPRHDLPRRAGRHPACARRFWRRSFE